MPSLKALKTRITSVKSTQQITRAMKLVAAAKMKRAIDSALASRPYSDEVTSVLQSLMARIDQVDNPLLQAHDEVKKVGVIVMTSDRGLCGGFNNSLLRKTMRWLEANRDEPGFSDVEVLTYGKKAGDAFRRSSYELGRAVGDLKPTEFPQMVAELVQELCNRYESGDLDEVYLVYNHFVNTLRQDPTIEKLFPLNELASGNEEEEPEHLVDFVYEPDQNTILAEILPLFLRTRLHQVFLESTAGEHAARMTAMDAASRNAKDVIDRLTLEYNRARQAAITRELVEIVAGAEAL